MSICNVVLMLLILFVLAVFCGCHCCLFHSPKIDEQFHTFASFYMLIKNLNVNTN